MTDRKINLDEIAEAAGKATAGPWEQDHCHVNALEGPKSKMWLASCPANMVASTGVRAPGQEHIDATHIALNDPATSKAFVEAVRALMTLDHVCRNCSDEPGDLDEALKIADAALQPFVDGEVGS